MLSKINIRMNTFDLPLKYKRKQKYYTYQLYFYKYNVSYNKPLMDTTGPYGTVCMNVAINTCTNMYMDIDRSHIHDCIMYIIHDCSHVYHVTVT